LIKFRLYRLIDYLENKLIIIYPSIFFDIFDCIVYISVVRIPIVSDTVIKNQKIFQRFYRIIYIVCYFTIIRFIINLWSVNQNIFLNSLNNIKKILYL